MEMLFGTFTLYTLKLFFIVTDKYKTGCIKGCGKTIHKKLCKQTNYIQSHITEKTIIKKLSKILVIYIEILLL